MALSSPGIGSNLDINGIVSQLMALEQRPLTALSTKEAKFQAQISALGSLKSAITALQTAASSLTPSTGSTASLKFTTNKTSIADTTIATATATSSAVAGNYSLDVTSLAKAQRLTSVANPALGTGDRTLTIEIGSVAGSGLSGVGGGGLFTRKEDTTAINVAIGSGVTTLAGVRDAINAANSGVTATMVTSGTNSYLSLTSNGMGTGNVIQITGDMPSLNYDPSTNSATGLVQNVGDDASDAVLKINGIDVTSSSNTITSAVDGLSITLLKAGATSVTVSRDTSSLTAGINDFVKAYNDVNTTTTSLGSYNSTTKVAGALNGDSTLRSAQSVLRTLIGNVPSAVLGASLQRLSDIGVSVQKNGSLTVDSSKLETAINKDFAGVANLISAYGSEFKTATDGLVGTSGLIVARTEGLNSSIKGLGKQSEAIVDRLTKIEARYRKQFTALDVAMSAMTTTSNFLTQQLASLPTFSNN